MSHSTLNTLFQQATLSFHKKQYQTCIALLNDCLFLAPNQLVLQSNRALASYHLGMSDDAFKDLNICVAADHLNYIAYFNLFSMFHLQQQYKQAYQNLVFCLSSSYTLLAKQQKNMQAVQKAIRYCFNNKEALMLKGLFYLEQLQYNHCLQMLSLVFNYENSPVLQAQIASLIRKIALVSRLTVPLLQQKNIGGKKFTLQTALPQPSQQMYLIIVKEMIQDFNHIYPLLQSQTQFSFLVPFNSRQSLSSMGQISPSFLKEDKTYCHTVNNSTLNNQSDSHIGDVDPHISRSSYTLFVNSTHINKSGSENSIIPEESSSLVDNWTQSMASSKPQSIDKPTAISFAINRIRLANSQSYSNLYTTLHCSQKREVIYRSPLFQVKSGVCEWTEAAVYEYGLASWPLNLTVKVFLKNFDKYQDLLLGQSLLKIDKIGTVSASMIKREEVTGNMQIRVSYSI